MHPMLTPAIQAVRSASKIIMRYIDQIDTLQINQKRKGDFVTQVDRLSEQEIIQTIQKMYPNHSFLAEESGMQGDQTEYTWIIDPIDGTSNFIHGFPHFAISIALKHWDKLELGVIYDPVRQELFTAARGRGAQLNQRRIRVSPCKKLDLSLIGTGFPFRSEENIKPYLKIFEYLFPKTAGMRRAGAATLDIAYVAAGRLDGFWEMGLKPWDIAAGALILKEAGGLISDFNGTDQYLENGNVLASNANLYQEILSIIKKEFTANHPQPS